MQAFMAVGVLCQSFTRTFTRTLSVLGHEIEPRCGSSPAWIGPQICTRIRIYVIIQEPIASHCRRHALELPF